jgi:hypothetical protein
MMMTEHIKQYIEYSKKIGNRKALYKVVASTFDVKRALYPGSHIDISPSFVIPDVVYIDNFKGAIMFFKKLDDIYDYVNSVKEYDETPCISFYGNDYQDDLEIEKVDLIVSQFAGFVGQSTKKYLKKGGVLLCNDSHGDATLAYHDPYYEFIGVVRSNNEISTSNLGKYFSFDRKEVDLDEVKSKMKGPKYKHQASNYLFKLK